MYPEPRDGIVFIQNVIYSVDFCVSKKMMNGSIKHDMQQFKIVLQIKNWK